MIRNALGPVFSLVACCSFVGTACGDQAFPAHRVAGNTYYVGSKELASFLITTPEGHFLINSSFNDTVPLIRGAVESLGFKMSDVKYLLASHAHSDHVEGHAKMRELTGAKVLVMAGDDRVISSGGEGQYLYAESRWPACPVDRVLKDGDTVTLGGVTLTARSTPGHTRGCTTWTWQETLEENGAKQKLDVVVIGSPNVNPGYRLDGNAEYPTIVADYERTFVVLKSLPCDVFLGAHGNYYDLLSKYERLEKKEPGNPFVDPKGYQAYVAMKEATFRKKLADQKVGPVDDGAIAERLRKVGADVTLTDGKAVAVSIKDTAKMSEAEFEALGRLRNVKTLSISGEGLNDRTLFYLTGMVALEDLQTNQAQLSDDVLWQFTLLSNLKQIKFFHTSLKRNDFTGRGLAQLATMKNVRRLTVAGCPFNDEGMAAVGKLTQLENFRTWHTYQTEAGNAHLKSLVNLKSLHLGQRLRRYGGQSNAHSLTDATLDVVAELKSLDSLQLSEQNFSAEALAKLSALSNLKQLELPMVDVPQTTLDRLRAALPSVQIKWSPLSDDDRAKLQRLLAP